MSGKISLAAIFTGSLLICFPAFSQDEGGRSEVSAQFLGSFGYSSSQNGVNQSSSDTGGVLASYRFFFTKHQGVEANYAYSRNTTSYNGPSLSYGVTAIEHEWSGAYVFRLPMGRITPFVEAGVGGLTFEPTYSTVSATSNQTRAAFIYGVGADLKLTHRVFVRAQYRGLVYDSPAFNIATNVGLDRVTQQFEPSVGFGYRF
jgi:opacity protein-like surface antigen